jgi:type IV pilus assembly protein PilC
MRTLSTMLKGGIPLLEALIITGKAVGNVVYEERLTDVVRLVEEGESFHAALKKSNLFPSLLVKMVKIGEESGNLEEMLEEASNYFDEEVDTMATTLASLLEPILMMILAAVFLGIMLSIILPVFTAGSQMPF